MEAVVLSTAIYEARPFLLLELTKGIVLARAMDMMILDCHPCDRGVLRGYRYALRHLRLSEVAVRLLLMSYVHM